jgi:oligosaccharide repeat unit polymerase
MSVFVVLLVLFNLGVVVPVLVFNAHEPFVSAGWLGSADLEQGLGLYIIAITCFTVGTCLYRGRRVKVYRVALRDSTSSIGYMWSGILVIGVIGYVVIGFYSGILTAPDRTLYMELRESGSARWFGGFRTVIVISAMAVIAFSSRRVALTAVVASVITFTPLFILGQRGFFIVTVAAFLVVLRLRGIEISSLAAAACGAVVFALIPIIRGMRGGVTEIGAGILDPIYEMGTQFRVILYSIDAIMTNEIPLQYGQTYVAALSRSVPNIGGLVDMLGGRGQSPSNLITELYSANAGVGMSAIAEAYMNFSAFGVSVIFFLLGLTMTYAEKISGRSPYSLAIYGATLGSIFWMVRADFFAASRPLAWAMFGIGATFLLARSSRRR